MKVQNWYDIECSICGKHLCDFGSDMQQSKSLAVSAAKEAGFIYDKQNNINFCPECAMQ